jgi:hypothetical protein
LCDPGYCVEHDREPSPEKVTREITQPSIEKITS